MSFDFKEILTKKEYKRYKKIKRRKEEEKIKSLRDKKIKYDNMLREKRELSVLKRALNMEVF